MQRIQEHTTADPLLQICMTDLIRSIKMSLGYGLVNDSGQERGER